MSFKPNMFPKTLNDELRKFESSNRKILPITCGLNPEQRWRLFGVVRKMNMALECDFSKLPNGGQLQVRKLPVEERTDFTYRPRLEIISRLLSSTLRHKAVQQGLKLSGDGYVALEKVLQLNEFQDITEEDILKLMEVDKLEKQRFGLKGSSGAYFIRANQGHTIKNLDDDQLLERVKPGDLDICVHGTFTFMWEFIKREGLKRMTRNHIHFAPTDKQDEVISGMRVESDVKIYVDFEQAMSDGIVFHRSANDVILTTGVDGVIPVKYFKKAVNLTTGEVLWPVKANPMPASILKSSQSGFDAWTPTYNPARSSFNNAPREVPDNWDDDE